MSFYHFSLSSLLVAMSGTAAMAATNASPTFNKEVLPILQKTVRNAIGQANSHRCPCSPMRMPAPGRKVSSQRWYPTKCHRGLPRRVIPILPTTKG